MKKLLALSLGIVFLVTIVSFTGCKRYNVPTEGPGKIEIKIKSVIINGGKHLQMSDNWNQKVIDNLVTIVSPGDTIYWKLKKFSGIKKIMKISSPQGKFQSFEINPVLNTEGYFEFVVPYNALPTEFEKYAIQYTLKDGSRNIIDPYLRIPEIGTNSSQ